MSASNRLQPTRLLSGSPSSVSALQGWRQSDARGGAVEAYAGDDDSDLDPDLMQVTMYIVSQGSGSVAIVSRSDPDLDLDPSS